MRMRGLEGAVMFLPVCVEHLPAMGTYCKCLCRKLSGNIGQGHKPISEYFFLIRRGWGFLGLP